MSRTGRIQLRRETVKRLVVLVMILLLLSGCSSMLADRAVLYSNGGCVLYIEGPEIQNDDDIVRALQVQGCDVIINREE